MKTYVGDKGACLQLLEIVGSPPKFILLDEHIKNLNISLKKLGINFVLTHKQMKELFHSSIYENIEAYDHLFRIAINSKKISMSLRPRYTSLRIFLWLQYLIFSV